MRASYKSRLERVDVVVVCRTRRSVFVCLFQLLLLVNTIFWIPVHSASVTVDTSNVLKMAENSQSNGHSVPLVESLQSNGHSVPASRFTSILS